MKTIKIIFLITILSFTHSNAQFTDDIESYPLGRYIGNHWGSWDGTIEKAPIVSDNFAHSGEKSMLISNFTSTDCILNLGQKNSGFWHLEWWMYLPNDTSAYYAVLGDSPPNIENIVTCGRVLQNEGSNQNYYNCSSPQWPLFTFENSYPDDNWFKIEINVDMRNGMENATFQEIVNNNIVIPVNTPFKLGGIDTEYIPEAFSLINYFGFEGLGNFYIDDIIFQEITLSIADYLNQKIKIYPIPTKNSIKIDFNNLEIKSLNLFNVFGSKIKNFKMNDKKLDLSTINSGIYFLNINTNKGKLVKKIIVNK